MPAIRKNPDFDVEKARDNMLGGTLTALASIFILIILFSTEKKTLFDWVGGVVAFLFFVLMAFSGVIIFATGWTDARKKTKWVERSVQAETAIVQQERICHERDDEDDTYEYRFGLEMIPAQKILIPDETVVWASVSKSSFARICAGDGKVRIFHANNDPFIFLIEGEF